jgi:hypothetical protein
LGLRLANPVPSIWEAVISLHKLAKYMERAKHIWEEFGLPRYALKVPWFGYSLGLWTKENNQ